MTKYKDADVKRDAELKRWQSMYDRLRNEQRKTSEAMAVFERKANKRWKTDKQRHNALQAEYDVQKEDNRALNEELAALKLQLKNEKAERNSMETAYDGKIERLQRDYKSLLGQAVDMADACKFKVDAVAAMHKETLSKCEDAVWNMRRSIFGVENVCLGCGVECGDEAFCVDCMSASEDQEKVVWNADSEVGRVDPVLSDDAIEVNGTVENAHICVDLQEVQLGRADPALNDDGSLVLSADCYRAKHDLRRGLLPRTAVEFKMRRGVDKNAAKCVSELKQEDEEQFEENAEELVESDVKVKSRGSESGYGGLCGRGVGRGRHENVKRGRGRGRGLGRGRGRMRDAKRGRGRGRGRRGSHGRKRDDGVKYRESLSGIPRRELETHPPGTDEDEYAY